LKKKLFEKNFLLKECEKDLAVSMFSTNKMSKMEEMQTLEELFDFDFDTKWFVRIVVCEMSTKSTRLMNTLSKIIAPLGLVHVAIQIGPYLIDWLNNSELRIRRVYESQSAMLFLYPNKDSFILPAKKEVRDMVVDFLFDWRLQKYSLGSRNCQTFVNDFLTLLDIKKNWTRKGVRPIRAFIENLFEVDRNNYPLSFYGVTKNITCHKDLKEFWKEIQIPLQEDIAKDPLFGMEIVDLIKSLERGYMSRKEHEEEKIDFKEYYTTSGDSKYLDGISYAVITPKEQRKNNNNNTNNN